MGFRWMTKNTARMFWYFASVEIFRQITFCAGFTIGNTFIGVVRSKRLDDDPHNLPEGSSDE